MTTDIDYGISVVTQCAGRQVPRAAASNHLLEPAEREISAPA